MNAGRTREAVDWFMRLREDDLSETDLAQWSAWCAQPENRLELERVRNTWGNFDRVVPVACDLLEAVVPPPTPSSCLSEGEDFRSGAQRRPMFSRRSFYDIGGAAVAAALVAALLIGFWHYRLNDPVAGVELTAHASIESTALPDGSRLTLAPGTSIAVEFTERSRTLKLARGEAYFKVRRDPSKPFVVHTPSMAITAVGTAFNVIAEDNRLIVTVREGAVEVASAAKRNSRASLVTAGQRLTFDEPRRVVHIEGVDVTHAVTWHEGRLEYFDAPLSTVIADIRRYSGRSIEMSDAQAARLAYTGSVSIGNVDDWLAALAAAFPIRVVVTGDGRTVLSSRGDGARDPAKEGP